MLPDVDGLEVCKILKNDSQTTHIPVMMLTAKGEESDIVLGLNSARTTTLPNPLAQECCWFASAPCSRCRQKDDQDDPAVITVDELQRTAL